MKYIQVTRHHNFCHATLKSHIMSNLDDYGEMDAYNTHINVNGDESYMMILFTFTLHNWLKKQLIVINNFFLFKNTEIFFYLKKHHFCAHNETSYSFVNRNLTRKKCKAQKR